MAKLLMEGLKGSVEFIIDRTTLNEGSNNHNRLPGRLSVSDVVNGNNRRYPRSVWESNLNKGSNLVAKIANRSAFGLLEHPKDGVVDLNSPLAVITVEAKLTPSGDVIGCIETLDTPEGNKLNALVRAGYIPRVSSRGYGTVVKENGVDVVQDDYVCEGWDIVMTPSFSEAMLSVPGKEDTNESLSSSRQERICESDVLESDDHMLISEVKSRLDLFKNVVSNSKRPAFESIKQFLQSVPEMHAALSEHSNKNPKDSWNCKALHESIDAAEKYCASCYDVPAKKSAILKENLNKSLLVVKELANTAKSYKKLAESTTERKSSKEGLFEEVVRRAKGWRDRAKKAEGKLNENRLNEDKNGINTSSSGVVNEYRDKYRVACGALDILTEKFHEQISELGLRVLELQSPEAFGHPTVQEMVESVTSAHDVVAISEFIESIESGDYLDEEEEGKNSKSKKSKCKDTKDKDCDDEEDDEDEDKFKNESIMNISGEYPRHLSLNESVRMVKRLSGTSVV